MQLVDKGTSNKLDQAHQALLESVSLLRSIANAVSPRPSPSPKKQPRPYLVALSNQRTKATLPYVANLIVDLRVGGDTAGRGLLSWGADSEGFWVPANLTVEFALSREAAIEVAGQVTVTWTPPSGTTNWDVTLTVYPTEDL